MRPTTANDNVFDFTRFSTPAPYSSIPGMSCTIAT